MFTEQMFRIFCLPYFLVHRTIASPTLPIKESLLNTLNDLMNLDIKLLFSNEYKMGSKSTDSSDQVGT